ncbi:MAG TPA: hypothetical protein VIM31_03425 [Candidatus Microsaccharimonas sp.]|jgi:hypothetical protein
MKIKQTVKKLSILFLGAFVLVGLAFHATPVDAASCGGVSTAIISCAQTGSCPGGENPYEGSDPKSDKTKTADYSSKYSHAYGVCKDGSVPSKEASDTGAWGVLLLAINILTAGVGIAAIGGIIYGSILYTSAGGSPEQVKKAMQVITNVVIGVVAYALMFSGLNFLIPGGLFN